MTPADHPDPQGTTLVAGPQEAGIRLDQFIVQNLAGYSRNRAARFIQNGSVTVNHAVKKPGYRLKPGDRVTAPAGAPPGPPGFAPEPVPLDVVHEDQSVIVINKPPGLVVHPAAGNMTGTLAHGLLHAFAELEHVGAPQRPGIVHRLDKNTSGLLVVARTQPAYMHLSRQFKGRTVGKTYMALVHGNPADDGGRIALAIYRHPLHRKKMAAGGKNVPSRARHAETDWRVIARYGGASLLECDIRTGRTHQVRVHLAAIGHPVIGDPVYGYRHPRRRYPDRPELARLVDRAPRQMLHAARLSFIHPETGSRLSFSAPPPPDMHCLIQSLAAIPDRR